MKHFPTVLFLVRAFAKLQRERSHVGESVSGAGGALRVGLPALQFSPGVLLGVRQSLRKGKVKGKSGGLKNHYVFYEKFSNSVVFGKGLRKTAARTLPCWPSLYSGWGARIK